MDKPFRFTGLCAVCLCLSATTGFGQDDDPALPPDAGTGDAAEQAPPAGQEVEVNEDNYRQFMELKDPMQKRNVLPENSYRSQAGLQKLDKLPEESQKHLRNQLREIILQGDQWQPGDEDNEFPYVPSEAAGKDPSLSSQEAEAWGELVDNYHAREAQIYANAPRSRAASAAGSSGTGSDNSEGSKGAHGEKDAAGEQTGQQSSPGNIGTEGSFSPGSANESGADSTAGVSQNAMEFLKNSGRSDAGVADSASDKEQPISDTVFQNPADSSVDSTDGASQNALEYLQQEGRQNEGEAGDTLTIEDLLNAQGISIGIDVGATSGDASEDEAEDNPPEKSGGGF